VATGQIAGSGRIVSQVRAAAGFTGIEVTNTTKVIITQDTVESLRIEVDDNILDRVTTTVTGGVLRVGLQEGSYNNVTFRVYVSMVNINLLESTGAADFSATGPISVGEIVCRITGAGTVTLWGTATSETVEIIGAGSIRNLGLVTPRCTALISGAGDIQVHVTEQLDAVISGTGSIVYAGDPPTVHSIITGLGNVSPQK
jgi:hypothetical protein